METHKKSLLCFFILLSIITLFAFWLRVRDLDRSSFWIDEILSVDAARHELPEMFKMIPGNKPPLDYLLLHYVLKFGENEFVARIPAAVYGTISVFVIGLIVTAGLGWDRRAMVAGCGAALLLTVFAFHLRYSQEARPYSLMFLSVCFVHFFMLKILLAENSNKWGAWLGLAIFSVIGGLTLYFAFVPLVLNLLFFIGRFLNKIIHKDSPVAKKIGFQLAGLIALLVLCVLVLLPLRSEIKDGVQEFTKAFPELSWNLVIKHLNCFGASYQYIDQIKTGSIPTLFYFLPFALVGFFDLVRQKKEIGIYFILHFFGGFVLLVSMFKFQNHHFETRYILVLLPCWIIAVAIGCLSVGTFIQRYIKKFPIYFPTIFLALFSFALVIQQPSKRINYRGCVEFINAHGQPGKSALITFSGATDTYCLGYYLRRTNSGIAHREAKDLEKAKSVIEEFPFSFLCPIHVPDSKINNWLQEFPQLAIRRFGFPVWYTFSPEILYDFADVKTRSEKTVDSGFHVNFGKEDFDFLGKGWGGAEGVNGEGYRWSRSKYAQIHFWTQQPLNSEIKFKAEPFYKPGEANQRMRILVNGNPIRDLEMVPGIEVFHFFLDKRILVSGLNYVEFQFSQLLKVKDVNPLSQDDRALSARFRSFEFHKAKMLTENENKLELNLKMNTESDKYLGEGWGAIEKDGDRFFRWANKIESELFFDTQLSQDHKLSVKVSPLVFKNWPGQSIKLVLNGQEISQENLKPDEQIVDFTIPQKSLYWGSNRLVFKFEWTQHPKDVLENSNDDRSMSVRFSEINLKSNEGE